MKAVQALCLCVLVAWAQGRSIVPTAQSSADWGYGGRNRVPSFTEMPALSLTKAASKPSMKDGGMDVLPGLVTKGESMQQKDEKFSGAERDKVLDALEEAFGSTDESADYEEESIPLEVPDATEAMDQKEFCMVSVLPFVELSFFVRVRWR